MDAIEQFRREAYRVWGISNKEVIYDTPKYIKRLGINKFKFKINYDPMYAAWPKSYKLSTPVFENGEMVSNATFSRVLVPIILFKENQSIKFKVNAWYDMSDDVHLQLIDILQSKLFNRLSYFQRCYNYFLPRNLKATGRIKKEDYLYEVNQLENQELVVNVLH